MSLSTINLLGECCDHIYESYCSCCTGECSRCDTDHTPGELDN